MKSLRLETERHSATIIRLNIILSILLLLTTACPPHQGTGPQPLKGFQEKVTALVTTSVRSHLRDDRAKQELLKAQLPSLEKKETMSQLIDELKRMDQLKELAEVISKDVTFELGKPENQEIKDKFDSPEIQREVVSAIILGTKRGLQQLGGG